MRVAVNVVVIFEVPGATSVATIRDRFYEAHLMMIGVPMETLTGQKYVARTIEKFDVIELAPTPART